MDEKGLLCEQLFTIYWFSFSNPLFVRSRKRIARNTCQFLITPKYFHDKNISFMHAMLIVIYTFLLCSFVGTFLEVAWFNLCFNRRQYCHFWPETCLQTGTRSIRPSRVQFAPVITFAKTNSARFCYALNVIIILL